MIILVHPAVRVVHPSDELARLAAEEAAYLNVSKLLTFHIGVCLAGCSDARGELCASGERLTGQLVDLLDAFDDDDLDTAVNEGEEW